MEKRGTLEQVPPPCLQGQISRGGTKEGAKRSKNPHRPYKVPGAGGRKKKWLKAKRNGNTGHRVREGGRGGDATKDGKELRVV